MLQFCDFNNMGLKWLLSSSFLVLLFMPSSHCDAVSEDCDLVKCITAVKDYLINLRLPSNVFSCKSLYNSTSYWCSDYCMHKYFPGNFKVASRKPHSFTEYCAKSLSQYSGTNLSCLALRSFELLTCFMNVSSITTNDVREDMLSKQSCRRSLEYPKCSSNILLSECGPQSVQFMTDLFDFVTNYFGISSCGEAEKSEVSNMHVHYNLNAEHMTVAKCFDKHLSILDICFTQLIQDEIDLHNYLCGDYDSINNCLEFYFDKYGKECQPMSGISHILLPKLFSFGGIKCKSNLKLQDLSTQSDPKLDYPKPFSYKKYTSSYLNQHGDVNSKDETDYKDVTVNSKDESGGVDSKDEVHDTEELNSNFSHQSWTTSASEVSPSSVPTLNGVDSETSLKMVTGVEKVNRNNKNETELLKAFDSNVVDVNYLKTSNSSYLKCDRVLFAIVYFIVIVLNIFLSIF